MQAASCILPAPDVHNPAFAAGGACGAAILRLVAVSTVAAVTTLGAVTAVGPRIVTRVRPERSGVKHKGEVVTVSSNSIML